MISPPRRIRIELAYDGTDFAGWQIQRGARTVQGVLTSALGLLQGRDVVAVRGAGRTDAGVHARGQVADAEIASRLPDGEMLRALASVLPGDVRPRFVVTVPGQFHSRFDAVAKTYRYRLDRSPTGDPFLLRHALFHPHPLDPAALADALSRLPGRRDWSGFAGSACESVDRVRTLTEASFEETEGGTAFFTFTADGFLNHMVRNLVGTLLEVGRGRIPPDRIDVILASRDRSVAGPTAPAQGLCLERVLYPEDGVYHAAVDREEVR